MRRQDLNITKEQKEEFWKSLTVLRVRYGGWRGLSKALNLSRQTIDNWRKPDGIHPNFHGRMPNRMTIKMINDLAKRAKDELQEGFMDDNL